MSSLQCTSCGAPIEIKNRFSKVVVCGYCGTHHRVKEEGIAASGTHAKLAEFPSIFTLGCTGTILGKPFTALGRMRYTYDGGFFDEWFLEYDSDTAWFAEDEGTYTLYTDMVEAVEFPDPAAIHAGQSIMIGDMKVMVREKGEAVVEGGEGELSYYVEPGTRISYIDGVSEGKKVSIEFTEDEVELFTGRPLLKRDITVN